MKKGLFSIFKILLSLALLIAVERFCHKQTDGFRPHKIASTLPFNAEWEVSPLSQEEQNSISAILDQPFYFLGSGGQSYAFVSEDGQTVLKLFKQHHLRPWNWMSRFPLPKILNHYRKNYLKKREKKLPFFFGSCKIAFEEFRDRTGLLYMHLNKTSHFKKKLKIIDKIGIAHEIDLDATEFALQQKAELAYPHLARLVHSGDMEGAKKGIDSLLDLILERCKRGIADRDPNIRRNVGFIGDKAVEIDLGSYYKDDFLKKPFAYKAELHYRTQELKHWAEGHCPSLLPYLNEQIALILEAD